MKAWKHLVHYALRKGHTVSVWDGEEWQVKRSDMFYPIKDAIESVDESTIRIRNSDGKVVAWAMIIIGLADDETVADYSDNEWMDAWSNAYESNEWVVEV
jgi:hypothetical protein